MNYTVEQVEDVILEALADIQYVKTLESYQGTLADLLRNPDQMIVKFPAIMVVFKSSDYHGDGYPVYVYRQRMRFAVVVAASSLRSEKDRRRGNTGTYQILEDVRDKLCGKKLGLNISPLRIVSDDSVFNGMLNGRLVSIYAATYETDIDFDCIP